MRLLIAILLPWLAFFYHRSPYIRRYLPDFATNPNRLDTRRYLGSGHGEPVLHRPKNQTQSRVALTPFHSQ